MAGQAGHESTRRGALIVVEGLDRAGKSSQCEKLRDYLSEQGHTVKYIRFPGTLVHMPHRNVNALIRAQTGPHPSGSS
jgi:thymidylate kinase